MLAPAGVREGRDPALHLVGASAQSVNKLPSPFDRVYGAAHSFDLPFVFGNFGPSLYSNISFTQANKAGRLDLSSKMIQSIGSFAREGNPNSAEMDFVWPTWPRSLIFDSRGSGLRGNQHHAISTQFHPEFSVEISAASVQRRRDALLTRGQDPDVTLDDLDDTPFAASLLREFVRRYCPEIAPEAIGGASTVSYYRQIPAES